jgi:hypothetical protein
VAGPGGDGRGIGAARGQGRVFLGSAIALWCLWLALVGTLDAADLVAGAVAATIGATAIALVRSERIVRFRPRLRWFLPVWRLPLRAVPEFGLVTVALGRHLVLRRRITGRFREIPLPTTAEDARGAGRRALMTAIASFTPNAYVVGIDLDRGTALVHELVPSRAEPAGVA